MNITEYRSKRFLIVDTIKTFAETLKQMLQGRGATHITMAYGGKDAVEKCKSVSYDVILMGYDLGEGRQNGQQALEELRTNGHLKRSNIFILITGETSQEMVLCALEHKPDAYLTKPFTPKDLIDRIEACYKKKMGMAQIYRAMDKQQHETVLQLCDNHIDNQGPYAAECLGIKSRQLFELKRFAEAMEIYQQKQDQPHCQWAAVGIGKIHLENKNYPAARDTFERIVKKYPLYLAAYDWLAKTYELLEEYEQAEETLSKALAISPRSLRRAKQFAELCESNHNFEAASDAYKHTLSLAKNSVHHSPKNRLNLARCLTEQAARETGDQAHATQTEVLSQIDQVQREFNTTDVAIEANLASLKVYKAQKNADAAHKALSMAENLWETLETPLDVDIKLAFAQTYADLNMAVKSDQLLRAIAEEHSLDPEVLAKVDRISETPLSEKGKHQAQQAIKIGIGLYNEHNFAAAIREFNAAIRLYPRHVGIKLNLIQALMMSFHQDRSRTAHLKQAKELVNELSYLPDDHSHYSRYKKLADKLNVVSRMA